MGLHESFRYSYQILMKLQFLDGFFFQCSSAKFQENSFSGSRVFFMRKDKIDMTNLLAAFRNFSNWPNKIITIAL